jgi:hypothetical protein
MENFVGAAHRHSRKVKIMRSGRHTQPSQVEKVAATAGKAAPVMAISAGALVAVPHGHAVDTAKQATVAAAVKALPASESKLITLSKVSNPDSASLSVTTTSYQAKHAKASETAASQAHVAHLAHLAHQAHLANVAHEAHLAHLAHQRQESSRAQATSAAHLAHEAHLAHLAHHSSAPVSTTTTSHVSHSAPVASHGHYSCSALESLWEEAGGSSGTAFMAAEIATAESGGNPNAVSPTDDFGLWQINGSHGSMATLDPFGNAKAAISISNDGHSWGAWTTYTSGAYAGRC